jgi:hypothetical protein
MSEGFAWGTFLLGPLWLAAHRTWIAAALSLAAYLLIAALAPPALGAILSVAVAVFLGLHGHDFQAWALEHRGYALVHLIVGRGRDEAWMRLMAYRPDLVAHLTQDLP